MLQAVIRDEGGATRERHYHYEIAGYPRFLTGITDERGVRYVSWDYDDQGRAVESVYADGVGGTFIDYHADDSVTVTNALGRETTYEFDVIQGVRRIVAINGEPTPNCPATNSTFTYDSRGLLTSRTDNRGVVTQYAYNADGFEISRTEAVGTPQSRTIATEWHPTYPVITRIQYPDQTVEFDYDIDGRLTGRRVLGQ